MATKRSVPLFRGPLSKQFEQFLAYRHALGTWHDHLLVVLYHLDRFLEQTAPGVTALDRDLVSRWLQKLEGRKPQTIGNYQRVARQFCQYRRRFDPDVYVPGKWPHRSDRSFRPHIFSEDEIRALLASAGSLGGGELRPHTIQLIILLLYTAGLRLSEPLRLQLQDYDSNIATLRIMHSKFGKSRLVPLSWTVSARVDEYLERRRVAGERTDPEAPLLINNHMKAYSLVTVNKIMTRLLRQVCNKPAFGRGGPRAHDLRHSMACHRLLRWYRDGVDVQSKLPLLATYMGHSHFRYTAVYLTATAELLSEANNRFYDLARALIAKGNDYVQG